MTIPQPPHVLRKERNDKILALLKTGLTSGKVAQMLDITRNIVCGVRERHKAAFDLPNGNRPEAQMKCAQPVRLDGGTAKCQWLEGEPHERDFCGKKAVAHQTPWCPAHYERVFLRRNGR